MDEYYTGWIYRLSACYPEFPVGKAIEDILQSDFHLTRELPVSSLENYIAKYNAEYGEADRQEAGGNHAQPPQDARASGGRGEGPAGDPAARLRGAHGAGHRPEGNLGEQEDQEPHQVYPELYEAGSFRIGRKRGVDNMMELP